MSPIVTYLLIIFLGLFALIIIIELIIFRDIKKFVYQTVILVAVIVFLKLTAGFPATRVAFGGVSPVIAIGIMLVCTLFGVAAHYIYYMEGKFIWRTFLKPLVISPIVLLPLIGSVQGSPGLEPVQMISFGVLAFQNGFFWKEVFEHAKSKIQVLSASSGAVAAPD
jgi:hypothetical protein